MNETICALATATGGALGIIRISGDQSLEILSHVFSKDLTNAQAGTIHYGHIIDPSQIVCDAVPPHHGHIIDQSEPVCDAVPPHHDHIIDQSEPMCDAVPPHHVSVIDEVLVSVFRAPHSYTGEDSVEISCHGSSYILNRVLELLVREGCRMAEPGEYTMRAYLNGRMDLSQAEAVADLIASSNRATHQMAMSQLRGGISTELSRLRDQLLKLTSLLELELDFSDHEDLEFADRSELLSLAQKTDAHITRLARSFETGQALKQGIPVAIVGKTNVGKSTLLNALLKDDRAIVSSIHGTTRDTIEDTIDIRGVTFRFIDTAGIRQTTDEIEQIGISRTFAAIDKASIVLWLIDEQPTEEEVTNMQIRCQGKSLIPVWNKSDILSPSPVCCDVIAAPIPISAKTGQGLNTLEQAIYAAVNIPTLTDSDIIVTNARHYEALTRAHEHLQRVIEGMGGCDSPLFLTPSEQASPNVAERTLHSLLPPDLISEDLRLVLSDLSEITGDGQITPQETLNNIFSRFCVGK